MTTFTNSPCQQPGWRLNQSYAHLPEGFFTRQAPVPVDKPKLMLMNAHLAETLGLNPDACTSDQWAAVFAGNQLPDGSVPLAQAYAGHQFGHFTMLGDGRAILLGEQKTAQGNTLDIQLKGSGPTPYSRGGDGRAALGPMLREYIISEAMYALGIPTSRSLAIVLTGEPVFRETSLPGAILARVSASHVRVGTFQYASHFLEKNDLKALADYTIQRHYPDLEELPEPHAEFLNQVIKVQAFLTAQWMLAGFVHGVMNTDNMSISGETIDYGPCAFMDTYHTETVFSSIDRTGRYAYGRQPAMAGWNLARFAETLLPLLHPHMPTAIDMAQESLRQFPDLYQNFWLDGMRKKLGILHGEPGDESLSTQFLQLLQKYQLDYTNAFRALDPLQSQTSFFPNTEDFHAWFRLWHERLARQPETHSRIKDTMNQTNPILIPRNHLVEDVLKAATEEWDLNPMIRLTNALDAPFDSESIPNEFMTPPPRRTTTYQTFCGT